MQNIRWGRWAALFHFTLCSLLLCQLTLKVKECKVCDGDWRQILVRGKLAVDLGRKVTKGFWHFKCFFIGSDWPRKKVTLTVFLITFGAKHNSTHVQLYNIRCTVRLRAANSISQSKTQCDDGRSCGAEFNAIRFRGRPQGDPAREASGPPVTLLGGTPVAAIQLNSMRNVLICWRASSLLCVFAKRDRTALWSHNWGNVFWGIFHCVLS